MNSVVNNEVKLNNNITWFDLGKIGVYMTPELICGKPCILLLDIDCVFTKAGSIKGKLEENGFNIVHFEFNTKLEEHLYILFTDSISTDFFYKDLCISIDKINKYEAPLTVIQEIFYSQARRIYGFRVDILVRSSALLGRNSADHEVYTSNFGRFKVSLGGVDSQQKIYRLEHPNDANIGFLRAKTLDDALICCANFVADAISLRRNVTLADVLHFAAVLYQDGNKPIDPSTVKLHELLYVFNCFNALYAKNILKAKSDVVSEKSFFNNADHFMQICLSFEACPSQPRAIYTDYFASQYTTPSPLAFIMQKLLVGGDHDTNKSVLDPMYGVGVLSAFLGQKGYSVVGIENNVITHKLASTLDYANTTVIHGDIINDDIQQYLLEDEKFDYVVCNPAYLPNQKKYEYKDSLGEYITDRMDFITLLRTLTMRKNNGRSVFLLPLVKHHYFSDNQLQQQALNHLVSFIDARYIIEGAALISSEIYSISLSVVSPLLIVIGDKRDQPNKEKSTIVLDAMSRIIYNYDALWDWANLTCYKRSPSYQDDIKVIESIYEYQKNNPNLVDVGAFESINEKNQDDELSRQFNGSPTILQNEDNQDLSFTLKLSDESLGLFSMSRKDSDGDTLANSTASESDVSNEADTTNDSGKVEADTTNDSGKVESDSEMPTNQANESNVSNNADTTNDSGKVESDSEITTDPKNSNFQNNDEGRYLEHLIKQPKNNDEKIAKVSGNFLALDRVNQIIRYHSVSTLSDPSSNIHMNEFRSYLIAKQNLSAMISMAFDEHDFQQTYNDFSLAFTKKLNAYRSNKNLPISPETLIAASLNLSHPRDIPIHYKAEHVDFIASAILKFIGNKSIFIADSLGMVSDKAIASMIHFYKLNKKGVVYFAESDISIQSLMETYYQLNQTLFKDKPVTFIVAHKELEHESNLEKILKSFKEKTVLILLNTPSFLTALRKKNLASIFSDSSKFACVFDAKLGTEKHSIGVLTNILKSPTIFRANNWINQDTNLSVFSGLFTEKIFTRYFDSGSNGLDSVSAHLLKLNLIENNSLFQRFEDLSNINIELSSQSLWQGQYSALHQSYSNVINRIVLLSEDICRVLKDKNDFLSRSASIRAIALNICELCQFSLVSIPLTHSLFNSIKDHNKPIVVAPQNIEGTLFSLLEFTDIPILGSVDSLKISKFVDLNDIINVELNKVGSSAFNVELLKQLIDVRNKSVLYYLTGSNEGETVKYPSLNSLISVFYHLCTNALNASLEDYTSFKKRADDLEREISGLPELPLNVIDFLFYELSKYGVHCAELSQRSFVLVNTDSGWQPNSKIPLLDSMDKNKIVSQFNHGDIDLIVADAQTLRGVDLSAVRDEDSIFSDHIRRRVLFFTYFNKPVEHFLGLIHSVNHSKQFVSPVICLEVADSIVQKTLADLLVRQLGKFNIYSKIDRDIIPDLSFYLTYEGQNLLAEYLSINPTYPPHIPTLPISQWKFFDVMNIANMVDATMQKEVIDHLAYLSKQHLNYLRDVKKNPFDVFTVSPKAQYSKKNVDEEILYLNKRITSSEYPFNAKIELVNLTYVKDVGNSLSLEDCKKVYIERSITEVEQLRNVIGSWKAIPDEINKHYVLLDEYIKGLTHYLINIYRDRVFNMLNDRYGNWIFKNSNCRTTYIKNHFATKGGIKISKNLDDLYFEICMLGDFDLIREYEKSCQILSFLTAYKLTIEEQEKQKKLEPILLSVKSPFNDKDNLANEGLLISVTYPASLMVSLSPKSFTVSIAYPNKSKLTDLSLSYVLENMDVLKDQNVLLKPLGDRVAAILSAYTECKLKDLLMRKLNDNTFSKLTAFTSLSSLQSAEHHLTIRAFNLPNPPVKLRSMNVLVGNLFEVFYFLRHKFSLTLADFVNEQGITQYGFVIPSDINIEHAITYLVRLTPIKYVDAIYEYMDSSEFSIKYLRSIQWFGSAGTVEAIRLSEDSAEVLFTGSEHQMQSILLDADLFHDGFDNEETIVKEEPQSKKQITANQFNDINKILSSGGGFGFNADIKEEENSEVQMPIATDQIDLFSLDVLDLNVPIKNNQFDVVSAKEKPLSKKTQVQKSDFSPIALNGATIFFKADKMHVRCKIPKKQFRSFMAMLVKKSLYSYALIDCDNAKYRQDLSEILNK